MNMFWKKLVSGALAILMTISLCPISALADTSEPEWSTAASVEAAGAGETAVYEKDGAKSDPIGTAQMEKAVKFVLMPEKSEEHIHEEVVVGEDGTETTEQHVHVEYPYHNWRAAVVVSFDRQVAKNSVGLSTRCDNCGEGGVTGWHGFMIGRDMAANTEIVLKGSFGSSLTYGKLCGQIKQILCGAFNLSDENIGTKMTVSLRIYEQENGSETGAYYTLASFKHTFAKTAQAQYAQAAEETNEETTEGGASTDSADSNDLTPVVTEGSDELAPAGAEGVDELNPSDKGDNEDLTSAGTEGNDDQPPADAENGDDQTPADTEGNDDQTPADTEGSDDQTPAGTEDTDDPTKNYSDVKGSEAKEGDPQDTNQEEGQEGLRGGDSGEEPSDGEGATQWLVKLTSRTAESASTVGRVSGGGVYSDGDSVTVTAYPRKGYTFVGWFNADDTSFGTNLYNQQSYTFVVSADTSLVALFAASQGALFRLTVHGSLYTVNNGAVQSDMFSATYNAGETMFLSYRDETKEFLYWVNASRNILSTQKDFSFALASDTEISSYYAANDTTETTAMVIFRNAYKQVIQSRTYAAGQPISYPASNPNKMGYLFTGWYIADENGEPTSTEATEAAIYAAMEGANAVVVVPGYVASGNQYTVTVEYTDTEGNSLKESVSKVMGVGDSKTFKAPAINGYTFQYWMLNGVKASYSKSYTIIYATPGEATLRAVYAAGDAAPEPTIIITQTYSKIDETTGKYVVANTEQYFAPEEYVVMEVGFVWSKNAGLYGVAGGADKLKLDAPDTKKHISGFTTNEGIYTFNLRTSNPDNIYFEKAYMILKAPDGSIVTYYSDMTVGSFNSLQDNEFRIIVVNSSSSVLNATADVPVTTSIEESVIVNNIATLTIFIEDDEASAEIDEGSEAAKSYDVRIEGVKADNTELLTVNMEKALPSQMSAETVRAYHEGTEMTPVSSKAGLTAEDTFYYDAATGDVSVAVTHFSNYTFVYPMYTIRFENEDGTLLQSSTYPYGAVPAFNGNTPTKGADAGATYTFAGWKDANGTVYAADESLPSVTGSATYTAAFTANAVSYTVRFLNYDGTELQNSEVAYGETPVYTGVTPAKDATDDYTYEFDGWEPSIIAVTGEATYTAKFRAVPRQFGEPAWAWTGDSENGYTSATATFTDTNDPGVTRTFTDESIEIVTTPATCTAAGKIVYTATVTFNEQTYTDTKTVVIAAPGHTEEVIPVVAATCTETGLTEGKKCSVCGEILVAQEVVEALGHEWGDWAVTTAATCTVDGVETRTCSRCGATETRAIAAPGHTEAEAVEENRVEATCTVAGSYDSVVYCSVCGAELSRETITIPAAGHDWDLENPVWGEPYEGDYFEYKVDITFNCKKCDEQTTVTATSGMVVEQDASCAEGGYKEATFEATFEGETFEKTIRWAEEPMDPTAHPFELTHTAAKAATCTEAGNSEYWYCGCCEKYFSDEAGTTEIAENSWVIPATGHDYEAVVTAPTCTEAGYTTHTCSRCGDTYTDTPVEALGHDLEHHEAQAATCSAVGWEAYDTCSRCEYTTYVEIPIDANAHDWTFHEGLAGSIDGFTANLEAGTAKANYVCSHDSNHTDTVDATITSVVTVVPTKATTGTIKYTTSVMASESLDGEAHSADLEMPLPELPSATVEPVTPKDNVDYVIVNVSEEGFTFTPAPTPADRLDEEYKFTAPSYDDIPDDYKGWNADYRLTFHNDFAANSFGLYGNYGSYGDVAFAFPYDEGTNAKVFLLQELVLPALTGTDGSEAFKIDDVATLVQVFKCGIFNLADLPGAADDNIGKKITVDLVIWSPFDTAKQSVLVLESTEFEFKHLLTAHAAVEATCTTGGNRAYWHCSRCGKYFSDAEGNTEINENSWEIAALGHDYVAEVTAPTCTEQGYTTHTCSRCGDSYVDTYVDATGHTWNAGEVTTEPNCTDKGVKTYTCTVCGATRTEEVAELGHTAAAAVEENRTEATCTEAGSYDSVVYCSVCGAEISRTAKTIPALGHALVHHEAQAATCTEKGWNAYDTCSRCDYTTYVEIPATGHAWGEPSWVWDGVASAMATFVCANGNHPETVNATITNAQGTGDDLGYTVYTATVNFNGTDYTDTKRGTAIEYTISYTLNDGALAEGVTNPVTYTIESDDITLNNPTREGYAFAGWTGMDLSAATVTVTILTGSTGNREYTATWNPIVTFKANYEGSTAADVTQIVTNGTATALTAFNDDTSDMFTREGYTFTSWNTAEDGSGTEYADEAEVTITAPLTLYAQWELPAASKFVITSNFENVDSYLYRVGNGNTVSLGSLFEQVDVNETISANDVVVKVYAADDATSVSSAYTRSLEHEANYTYSPNQSDWKQSTLKFTGEGPVQVSIKAGQSGTECLLNLEVVNGNNATTATSATSVDIVLLNDVSGSVAISGGHTLYGNGFTVTDTRNQPSGTAGFVNITNGIADNVKFVGYEPTTAVASGVNNNGYAPAMNISGGKLYNCYISGGRYAAHVNPGTAYFKGTMIDGGAIGNMNIAGGDVILEDCITSTSTRGGLKGLGIHVTNPSSSLTIKGTFRQYNWLTYNDMPSKYMSALGSVFNDANYAYSKDGKTYVNMGVFGLIDGQNFTETLMRSIIHDQSGNSYGYLEKTALGYTGTLYTAKATLGSAEAIADPTDERMQYDTLPKFVFDYTNKIFIPNTGDDHYCIYDSATETVRISLKQQTVTDTFSWDPMILTATKFGNELDYTVAMSGVNYTDSMIEFSESGDYTVSYTITDPYNYDEALEQSTIVYTQEVQIHVTIVEPEAVIYHPKFTYASSWISYAAKTVTIGSDTYVMPDVSATSSTVGSTTVGGQTVYYPIVTVDGKSSNGGTYSSGKIYCFAPAFSAINIKDLNKDTGETLYTYNSSTQKWPHNINATTGPGNSAYYGPAGTRDPYGAQTGPTYEKYAYNANNGGLCYTSNEIERNITANTKTVKFHYVGNDGITYYYYIQYKYNAVTYSGGGCLLPGTTITLANGTQKPVEQLTGSERLLVWNLETGSYDSAEIFCIDHKDLPEQEYTVDKIMFSDGTFVEIVGEQGFFDLDLAKYVYIDQNNSTQYLGHSFVKIGTGDSYESVTLTGVETYSKVTKIYSPVTFSHFVQYANGMLTMPGEISGYFNYFEVDTDTLKYNEEKKAQDIETYGLVSYEEYGLIPEYTFNAFNTQYVKIALGKGLLDWEENLARIEHYMQFIH